MSTLNVLPSELVCQIFNHAVQDTAIRERSLVALTLTHVCRSFRYVALDLPQLWTSLYRNKGHPNLAFIDACIERSKDEPLDVAIQFYKAESEEIFVPGNEAIMVDRVIEKLLPHSARWRSCEWLVGREPSDGEFLPYFEIRALFDKVHAPVLEELSITTSDFFLAFIHHLRSGICWNAPNLHSASIMNSSINVIPISFRSCLHSLTINHRQASLIHHFTALRRFGPAATSLTTLRLSLIDCAFSKTSSLMFSEFPSVKSLCIEMLNCKQLVTVSRAHLIWHEFRTFYFPNVVKLDIVLSCGDDDHFKLWKEYNVTLYSLLGPSLVHKHRYPSLETLTVSFQSNTPFPAKWEPSSPEAVVIFPTCCVPSLKHLRMQSARYWTLMDSIGEYNSSQPPYFESGGEVVPIALETVTFDLPLLNGVVAWVKRLASNMRLMGCWDNFEHLAIFRDGNMELISRDEVEHWCKVHESSGKLTSL